MKESLAKVLIRYVSRACVWPFDRWFTAAVIYATQCTDRFNRKGDAKDFRPGHGKVLRYNPDVDVKENTPTARRRSQVNSDLDDAFSSRFGASLVLIEDGEELLRKGYRVPVRHRDKVIFLHMLPGPAVAFWSLIAVVVLFVFGFIWLPHGVTLFTVIIWLLSLAIGSIFVKSFERSVVHALSAQQYLLELSILNDLAQRFQQLVKAEAHVVDLELQLDDAASNEDLPPHEQAALERQRAALDKQLVLLEEANVVERASIRCDLAILRESSPSQDVSGQIKELELKLNRLVV